MSIGCYLGRECSVGDYSRFSMYNMQHRIAHVYPLETIANIHNSTGPPSSSKKESINLRRLDFDQYLKNQEEKESYKVLHQLEFNSLREQSLHKSAKE